jgi:hypothetical protein
VPSVPAQINADLAGGAVIAAAETGTTSLVIEGWLPPAPRVGVRGYYHLVQLALAIPGNKASSPVLPRMAAPAGFSTRRREMAPLAIARSAPV